MRKRQWQCIRPAGNSSSKTFKNSDHVSIATFLLNGGLHLVIFRFQLLEFDRILGCRRLLLFHALIAFDVADFSSISIDLLNAAQDFASNYDDITDDLINIILHARKS